MSINIEKSKVGVPKKITGRKLIYPYRDMDIGDSFFVPGKRHGSLSGMMGYAKTQGIILTARIDTVNGVKGLRVYRER